MALIILSILVLNCIYSDVKGVPIKLEKVAIAEVKQDYSDLNSDASTYYSSRHSERDSNNYYPHNYENGITGYGVVGTSDDYEYDNYVGGSNDYRRYNTRHNSWGNGGYGGYGGNGGLKSYYGYNRPNYQGAYHLGYGYHKSEGYGSIYNNGITPSLVTGYRGYSKK